MRDAPRLDELVGDTLGKVDRDREADSLRRNAGFRLPCDQRVDPDNLPGEVHERPTGVPRVDGRISLDQVEQERAGRTLRLTTWIPGRRRSGLLQGPAERADD